ncbi:hypothetical protein GOODEAATRI_026571 [Goodea atripinnis]|uniref:Uncharacterized protein n=1 Tax=Goodea atripinnis TaxID=208336 RepID=A0ABV0NNI3_9TELE
MVLVLCCVMPAMAFMCSSGPESAESNNSSNGWRAETGRILGTRTSGSAQSVTSTLKLIFPLEEEFFRLSEGLQLLQIKMNETQNICVGPTRLADNRKLFRKEKEWKKGIFSQIFDKYYENRVREKTPVCLTAVDESGFKLTKNRTPVRFSKLESGSAEARLSD